MTIQNEKMIAFAALGLGAFYVIAILPKRRNAGTGNAASFYRRNAVSPAQAGQGAPYLTDRSALYNTAGGLLNKLLNRPIVYTDAVAGMPHASARDNMPYEPFEANFPTSASQDGTPANPVPGVIDASDPNAWGEG